MSETEPHEEGCDYCADHVPAKGYWRCPVCDAEWGLMVDEDFPDCADHRENAL